MKIGILSDIHDNLWNLSAAVAALEEADLLLCCGDLCSPFVIPQLARFSKEVHIVFGNNDADLYRITLNASKHSNIHLHGEWFESSFEGQRFGMNHFDYIARNLAGSGRFDVVCFGHNHIREISRSGNTLLINPGPIMGAKFASGWEDVEPTFVIYDTAQKSAALFALDSEKRAAKLNLGI
jgi:putative phosphoesterase